MSSSPHSRENKKLSRNTPTPQKVSSKVKCSIQLKQAQTEDEADEHPTFSQSEKQDVTSANIKVVFVKSTGDVSARSPDTMKRQLLINNIVLKNWQAVSKSVFEDTDISPYVLESLGGKVSKEFKHFCGPHADPV